MRPDHSEAGIQIWKAGFVPAHREGVRKKWFCGTICVHEGRAPGWPAGKFHAIMKAAVGPIYMDFRREHA